jgi:hypothetical protein
MRSIKRPSLRAIAIFLFLPIFVPPVHKGERCSQGGSLGCLLYILFPQTVLLKAVFRRSEAPGSGINRKGLFLPVGGGRTTTCVKKPSRHRMTGKRIFGGYAFSCRVGLPSVKI